ncbi:hypothetical protein GH714_011123 [Hevea brasiliensis]|uniref:Uncharacterized protein n=1 Tax=Hevea brasiliensis TaxID=3981 RepID=A0A6A6NGH0_HEVBR|nr:hypothetical protein GH714_011123 [Hevea brasiliensis]
MTGCAARATPGHSMSKPNGQLPKSYSMGSSISNDNDDYMELIRAASVRSLGHKNEIDMLLQQMKQESMSSKQLPKSCSVGMGFMGRIDEEKPSDEEAVAMLRIRKQQRQSWRLEIEKAKSLLVCLV